MRNPWVLLLLLPLLLAAPLRAEDSGLTTPTLMGWCRDARALFQGIDGMVLSQLDMRRSNATACAAYLRGWIDHQNHLYRIAPQLGTCARDATDNDSLVQAFLKVAERPGLEALPANEAMVVFAKEFCKPSAPPARTEIVPEAPTNGLAPPPQSVIQEAR